jgi:transcriptional regulator with XRE-family HTH domain
MTTSEVIDRYIKATGIRPRRFAVELGVSRQSLYNWRTGRYTPSASYLLGLLLEHNDWRKDFALEALEAQGLAVSAKQPAM